MIYSALSKSLVWTFWYKISVPKNISATRKTKFDLNRNKIKIFIVFTNISMQPFLNKKLNRFKQFLCSPAKYQSEYTLNMQRKMFKRKRFLMVITLYLRSIITKNKRKSKTEENSFFWPKTKLLKYLSLRYVYVRTK